VGTKNGASSMMNIRMPHDLMEAFQARAAEMGVPYQALMKQALREWMQLPYTLPVPELLVPAEPGSTPPEAPAKISVVYFIQTTAPNRLIKVGVTTDLRTRLQELQTAQPYPLNVLYSMRGGITMERDIHRVFAHLRVQGEWFSPGPELMAYIDGIRRAAPPVGTWGVHTLPVVEPEPVATEPVVEASVPTPHVPTGVLVPPEGEPLSILAEPSDEEPEAALPRGVQEEERPPEWDFLDSV
jgi:hypothetical protein